jgi:hypothetical protein
MSAYVLGLWLVLMKADYGTSGLRFFGNPYVKAFVLEGEETDQYTTRKRLMGKMLQSRM